MKGSNTVDGVRADDGEEGHADLLVVAFFDQRHPRDLCLIVRIFLSQLFEVGVINLVDKIQMTGKQFSDKATRPLFQSFGQNSMVSVGEGVVHNIPGLLVGQLLIINEDPEQLDGTNGRVSIVELNLIEGGKLIPVLVIFFESADDVMKRS